MTPASSLTGRAIAAIEVLALFVFVDGERTLGFTVDSVLLRTGGLGITFAAVAVMVVVVPVAVLDDEIGGLDVCVVTGAVVDRLGPGRIGGLLVLTSNVSLPTAGASGNNTLLAPPMTLGLAAAVGS